MYGARRNAGNSTVGHMAISEQKGMENGMSLFLLPATGKPVVVITKTPLRKNGSGTMAVTGTDVPYVPLVIPLSGKYLHWSMLPITPSTWIISLIIWIPLVSI